MADTAELYEELLDIIAKEGLIDRAKLTPDATLETLNFASYDMAMILMAIEEKYGVYLPVDAEISEVKSLGELVTMLAKRIQEQQANPQPRPAEGAAAPAPAKAESAAPAAAKPESGSETA